MMDCKTPKVFNNDFVYENGRIVMLEGTAALRQITQNRLKLWLGEWFLGPKDGIDWLGLLNQKNSIDPVKRISTALRNQILSDPRIKKINSMSVEYDRATRKVSATMSLLADEEFKVTI